jgi:hypothetical protein
MTFDEQILIVIFLTIILVILILEYIDQDCIDGKPCQKKIDPVPHDASVKEHLHNIHEMVQNNYSFSVWRHALLVGLISAFFVIYVLCHRCPTLVEWIIVALIIMFIVFFSHSWLWTHFYYPNSQQIERGLRHLNDIMITT